MLHWEDGFLLTKDSKEDEKNSMIWTYPYERLRCSSDDAKHLLWLDFGGEEGEQVSVLDSSLSASYFQEPPGLEKRQNSGH